MYFSKYNRTDTFTFILQKKSYILLVSNSSLLSNLPIEINIVVLNDINSLAFCSSWIIILQPRSFLSGPDEFNTISVTGYKFFNGNSA